MRQTASLSKILAYAIVFFASPVQAQQCPNVSVEEYTDSRFVFCREHIEERLRSAYLRLRYDGSERLLSFPDVESFILEMNALARGNVLEGSGQLADDPKLRAMVRGLIAGEVYDDKSVEAYCRFKFPTDMPTGLALPSSTDAELVRDVDFFFGCLE